MPVADFSFPTLIRNPRNGSQDAPALILLHGVGSNEEDLFALAPTVDERFFVLAARAPLTLGSNQYGWYHIRFSGADFIADPTEIEAARVGVVDYVTEVRSQLGIGSARIVLGGFSQGAIMSMLVGMTTPEQVGGIVAMSGRTLSEAKANVAPADSLRGFPILVTHGIHDEVIPVHHARETRDFMASLPIELTYVEYPTGHGIGEENWNRVRQWLTAWADRT